MASGAIPCGASSGPITSSGVVKATSGVLVGILVSSTSSGTIKAYDNATGATAPVLFDTITPAVGYLPCNIAFANGLYFTIGGTISCVAIYA